MSRGWGKLLIGEFVDNVGGKSMNKLVMVKNYKSGASACCC